MRAQHQQKPSLKNQCFQLSIVTLLALFVSTGCAQNASFDDINTCECAVYNPAQSNIAAIGKETEGTLSLAQEFTVSANTTIAGLQVSVGRAVDETTTPPPSQQLIVSIHSDLNSKPDNTPLISSLSSTIAESTVSFKSFCFSQDCLTATYTLAANTTYWLVITRPGGNTSMDPLNYPFVGISDSKLQNKKMMLKHYINVNTWFETVGILDYSSKSISFRLGCNTGLEGCSL